MGPDGVIEKQHAVFCECCLLDNNAAPVVRLVTLQCQFTLYNFDPGLHSDITVVVDRGLVAPVQRTPNCLYKLVVVVKVEPHLPQHSRRAEKFFS